MPDVDVPQARVPFGFIRAAGSYLAQAVLGEDRYWAAGGLEGAQGSRREQESSIPRSQDEDVAVALTVVQRPEIKKTLQTPRSKCKPVNPYASIPSHPIPSRRTGVQPSHPYLRALRSISISISLHAARLADVWLGLLEGRTELRRSNSVPRRARSGHAGLAEESTKIERQRLCNGLCLPALQRRLASWGRL